MIPFRRTILDRQAAFSFSCSRCLQCCRKKIIQVNPYEVARLARNLGISTTDFITRYTVGNGSFLKFDESSSCRFLGPEGCRVHPDRPLVCRLYPLGRHVNDKKNEWFSELQPEAECRGEYGTTGTIENYLEEQDAMAYMLAADSYLNLLWDMMTLLEQKSTGIETAEVRDDFAENKENILSENRERMDMDASVGSYCRLKQTAIPHDVEEKMHMHQEILQLWANGKI